MKSASLEALFCWFKKKNLENGIAIGNGFSR